ncbi:hypothetical protein M436DRAFT_79420 [Aureobasidium namibiae CBS 147.97]|uniref:Uncharacterized protein n=1 Tax=Aureobasidium namibiae CBS 147.97 TaxID=1043004 RepID=A0A074WSM2_9PEZI
MVLNDKAKQTAEKQLQALQEELQALREDKIEVGAENEELRLIHMRQEDRIDQLRKDIDGLIDDNETLRDDYDEVTTDNKTLRDEYDEVKAINRTLHNNIADLNNNVYQWEKYALEESDQLTKLNAYTDELEQRLKESKAHSGDLEERNEELEDRLITERIESQALEVECEDLERKNKALWSTVNYLDGLSEEDQIEVMRMRKGVIKLKKLWEAGELD